jgi:hypothetical protein
MSPSCDPLRLHAAADGESSDPHPSSCPACAAQLAGILELKARLARAALPAPPRAFDRARLAPRRAPWAVAAAAAFAALLLPFTGAPADLHASSARLHDDILSGRVVPRDLGIAPWERAGHYPGGCACPAELGAASPFLTFRAGGAPVSLLALEETSPSPEAVRRLAGATVLAESHAGLRLIWIARLDEAGLRAAAARLRPPPARSLRAFTCRACCALLAAREGPVSWAPASIELVTGLDGRPLEPDGLPGRLRPAP